MTLESGRNEQRKRALRLRISPVRVLLTVCLLLFALLAALDLLAPMPAILAAGVTIAAALWSEHGVSMGALPSTGAEARSLTPSRTQQEILDSLIAALPDPAVVLESEGTVVAANSGARALAPALQPGEPIWLALRMPAVIEAIRRAGGGAPQRAEFSERVPVDRWFEAHVAPIATAPADARQLLLLTFHDLTPLRQVEEMRADFVANASHELRTPLAALSGFIDTLQGPARADPAARERFLAIMREQAGRMGRLIDDLLSLSRIERNARIRPEDPVDLVSVLRQVVDGLQPLAREREVAVSVTAPDRLVIAGDRDELIRAFENLVENALKYGSSGKRVEIVVEAGQAAREAKIAVRDFGPGIAAEHLPRLTERFYRVDVGQSRAEGGTGLGLALVKHVLNRHRGRLTIESTRGAGSTFTAWLPLSTAAAPGEADFSGNSK